MLLKRYWTMVLCAACFVGDSTGSARAGWDYRKAASDAGGSISKTWHENVSEPVGGAIDQGKKQAGKLAETGKQAAGAVADQGKKELGTVAKIAKQAGGVAADQGKKQAGKLAENTKRAGGVVADAWKVNVNKPVGNAAESLKKQGGHLPIEVKKAGGTASDAWKTNVNEPAGKVALDVRKQGGQASDWWKEHVNKPVGAPWNRVIRDPWARFLDRTGSTGQHRLDQTADSAQNGITDGVSQAPQTKSGSEFEQRKVPNGKVTTSPLEQSVLAVDAPQGGAVGFRMFESVEGRSVEITMWVMVEKGRVHGGLGRDDGQLIATSSQPGERLQILPNPNGKGTVEFQKVTFTTKVPSDGKGYGHTDSAHDYQALLVLEPGSKVQVIRAEVHGVN